MLLPAEGVALFALLVDELSHQVFNFLLFHWLGWLFGYTEIYFVAIFVVVDFLNLRDLLLFCHLWRKLILQIRQLSYKYIYVKILTINALQYCTPRSFAHDVYDCIYS